MITFQGGLTKKNKISVLKHILCVLIAVYTCAVEAVETAGTQFTGFSSESVVAPAGS